MITDSKKHPSRAVTYSFSDRFLKRELSILIQNENSYFFPPQLLLQSKKSVSKNIKKGKTPAPMTHPVKVGRCGGKASSRVTEPGVACPAPPLICPLILHSLSDAQFPCCRVTIIPASQG